MVRIFFLAIVIYLLYRLIFELIIPIFTTTKHIRKQFNNMQDNANASVKKREEEQASKSKTRVGEYIEFEEIKN